MLVIISDLHLNDESSCPTLPSGVVDIFAHRLRELANAASWRADGRYRPVERIDLVLLGDVVDLIRSQRWQQTDARPWHDTHSPGVVETINGIADDIIRKNTDALHRLRSLAADGAICVSPPSQSGQPVYGAEGFPIPVRTHYVVGNHDWHLHLRGESYDMIRQKVAHHMGLANAHTEPFPHDPIECNELLGALRRHRVFARHGDVFDPLSFTEDRDSSSVSDAISIELATRFVTEIHQRLGDDLPAPVAASLREIDFIRPQLWTPVWLEGVLERFCPHPSLCKVIKHTWDNLADELIGLPLIRELDGATQFNLIDGLNRSLKFSKRLAKGWAEQTRTWLQGLRGAGCDSYSRHALEEQEYRNRRAQHIVYGHTHHTEIVPLDASYADGYVLNQLYFNTGTWRRTFRPTNGTGQVEFIPAEELSFVAFFQGDERSGRQFESWSGTLGTAAISEHAEGEVHARQQPVPASSVPASPGVSAGTPVYGHTTAQRF